MFGLIKACTGFHKVQPMTYVPNLSIFNVQCFTQNRLN